MSLFSKVTSSLRTLLFGRQAADEITEEVRFHLDCHTQDLIAQGKSEAEARRLARVDLGIGPDHHAEYHRETVGLRFLDETLADLRYGLRGLWRSKGFTAVAVLSMALGIGATTAMFSVVYAVLLDIYPYADSERTVNPVVHDPHASDDWAWFALTPQQYDVYRQARSFEDVTGQASAVFSSMTTA